MKKLQVAVATLLLAGVSSASAGLVVYTDRATWEAAVSGTVATEDFNSVAAYAMSTGVNAAGEIDIELFGSPTSNRIDDGSGFASIDGSNYYHGALDFGTSMAGVLSSSISAFGADWTSATTGGGLILTILGDTVLFTDHLVGSGNGFLGVISDAAFSTITLDTAGSSAEQFGMDNFSFSASAAVPEPGSLALIGLGLAGIGFFRKNKTI